MRKILLSEARPGMILAKNIYSDDGRVLLASDMELTQVFLDKLAVLNIPAIFIRDNNLPPVEVPDIITEQTRQRAISNVRDIFNQLAFNDKVDLKKVTESVNEIIDELLANPSIIVNLADIRSYDNYTFGHCTNVCSLAVITGISLGLNQLQLKELGIGAILHDIGKIKIDKKVLNKPAKLTDEEFVLIKEHSFLGFDILRKIESISAPVAHIAFQHHEKHNGSGYPRGLIGSEIHNYAKIVAVADVYDALVADRVYRNAYSVQEAVEAIAYCSNFHFDEVIVRAFLKKIAVFPIGNVVKLSTGDLAIVIDVNSNLLARPVVKMLYVKNNRISGYGTELDLSKEPSIIIEKVIKPNDPEYILMQN